MNTQDYQAMLRAIDDAIAVCDQASGSMDDVQREMCAELRNVRAQLRRLIGLETGSRVSDRS